MLDLDSCTIVTPLSGISMQCHSCEFFFAFSLTFVALSCFSGACPSAKEAVSCLHAKEYPRI